jgi:hypothetical protein
MDAKSRKDEKILEDIIDLCQTRPSDPALASRLDKLEKLLQSCNKDVINMKDAYVSIVKAYVYLCGSVSTNFVHPLRKNILPYCGR